MNLAYENIVTGRHESMLAADVDSVRKQLDEGIRNSRVAVVGAAGSIGSAVVKTLLRFAPGALVLIDISENNLVELVRNLRSSSGLRLPEDFTAIPIAMGSLEFKRYFAENQAYDYLFNLSAIKHVRSEKNIYSLIRMIDTNVVFLHEFLEQHETRFRKVFSVSSDKATNPANLMGASKMAMEKMLLYRADQQPFSTARFANVAFSDGSLPYGFLRRIECRQPLAAPRDVRRFFISHQEAGELCVLSAITGENREVYFPKLEEGKDEKTFSDIAEELLHEMGYEPYLCESEEEARKCAGEMIPQNRWPCYFFDSDTTGEKDYEEFYASNEKIDLSRFAHVGIIHRDSLENPAAVEEFLAFAKFAKNHPDISKEDYVRAMKKLIPSLQHHETGKNLDGKM